MGALRLNSLGVGRDGLAVLLEMCFGRFLGVVRCVEVVSAGYVRVMCRRFVLAGFVMLGRFVMMLRRLLVMMRGLLMVRRTLMIRHCRLLVA